MIGVLGHDSSLLRLYWAGDNLGEWDECIILNNMLSFSIGYVLTNTGSLEENRIVPEPNMKRSVHMLPNQWPHLKHTPYVAIVLVHSSIMSQPNQWTHLKHIPPCNCFRSFDYYVSPQPVTALETYSMLQLFSCIRVLCLKSKLFDTVYSISSLVDQWVKWWRGFTLLMHALALWSCCMYCCNIYQGNCNFVPEKTSNEDTMCN